MRPKPLSDSAHHAPGVDPGLIELGPGEDARSRLVSITDAGRAKRIEAQRAWKQAQLALNDRLGLERVTKLHALIDECMALLRGEPGDGEDE